ncbi:MAG: hypothetical protein AAAB35_15275 [Phyllobacterium sp.]|uniref:hypothetical protein n=1 Tax=Phyllobacterium sp. TaxID=1871046 RepID=UPI0030F02D6C
MRILLTAIILSLSLLPATAADFELIVHQAGGGAGEYSSQAYFLNHKTKKVYNCSALWQQPSGNLQVGCDRYALFDTKIPDGSNIATYTAGFNFPSGAGAIWQLDQITGEVQYCRMYALQGEPVCKKADFKD